MSKLGNKLLTRANGNLPLNSEEKKNIIDNGINVNYDTIINPEYIRSLKKIKIQFNIFRSNTTSTDWFNIFKIKNF